MLHLQHGCMLQVLLSILKPSICHAMQAVHIPGSCCLLSNNLITMLRNALLWFLAVRAYCTVSRNRRCTCPAAVCCCCCPASPARTTSG
jgi:hypothetical protein